MWKKILVSFVITGVIFFLASSDALAAPFTMARIRYDRMKVNQAPNVQVVIVPATAGTENKVRVVFGAGITVGAGVSVTVTNLGSGVTELPGALTIVGAGQSVTVSGVNDLTVGTTYAFNISTGISTPATASSTSDSVSTLTAANAEIDRTSLSSRFIDDDQISITAVVPPSFTFTFAGGTDLFTSDLSASSVVSTNGKTLSVTTNAAKGWIAWVKSQNAALSSATTAESIGTTGTVNGTPNTCQIATDCYVLDANVSVTGTGSGSLTINAEYNGADTNSGGTLSTSLQPLVSRTGKTDGDTIIIYERASIVATKAAATDYTDTLTIVGAGNF